MLSVVMHAALLGVCAWYFQHPLTTDILAAGEGQGGGESVIEVGTVDGKTLGFTPYRNVSYVGDDVNTPNNQLVSTEAPKPDPKMALGVGVNSAANLPGGTSGVPGGSECGRRLQMVLGRKYHPPPTNDAGEAQF